MTRRLRIHLTMVIALLATTVTILPASAQNEAGLESTQWQLVTLRDSSGALAQVPPGIGVTMLLFFGKGVGDGACSTYEETAYSVNGPTLQIFEPTIVRQACDAEAQRVDDDFYGILPQVSSFAIDGSAMRLLDPANQTLATFTRGQVPADPTIAPWRLQRIANAEGTSDRVVEGSLPGLSFLPGGRLIGDTGCGPLIGSWTVRGSQVTLTDIASRFDNCTNDLRDQADTVVATLEEIREFTVRPAGLALEDDTGIARLALVPDIALAGRNWAPIATFDRAGDVRLEADDLRTASVRFSRNDVTGRTPCPRDYTAGNQRAGLAVTVFDPETEGGRCRQRAPRQAEASFLDSLQQVASHALRGSELELLDVEGRPVMRLLAQPGLRDLPWRVVSLDVTPGRRSPRLRPPADDKRLTIDFGDSDVLTGDTGRTSFSAFYDESGGATIDIFSSRPDISGCGGRAGRTDADCRLEAAFLGLLESADGYEMRTAEEQMVLLRGNRVSMVLEPDIRGATR